MAETIRLALAGIGTIARSRQLKLLKTPAFSSAEIMVAIRSHLG